jgi:hypothetical protein
MSPAGLALAAPPQATLRRMEPWPLAVRCAALLLAALPLAGCSGDAPADDPVLGPDGEPVEGGVDLPQWAVGDWWSYGIEAGAGGESAPTTYVVTADQGADWWMDTDSPERAFQDARDDNSRLGAQRKSDLAGSQGSDRVQFFQWPLEANATWTTRWDRQDATIRVEAVDDRGATLSAHNATHRMYTYRYDAAAGWFQRLDRHGPDGAVAFTLLLLDHGTSWKGTAVRWTLQELLKEDMAPGTVNLGLNAFPRNEVPPGTTDLWLAYAIPCEGQGGGYTIALKPEDPSTGEEGYDASGQCQGEVGFAGVAVEAPVAPTWTLAMTFGSAPTPDGLSFELLARTLVETPVGA